MPAAGEDFREDEAGDDAGVQEALEADGAATARESSQVSCWQHAPSLREDSRTQGRTLHRVTAMLASRLYSLHAWKAQNKWQSLTILR